MVVSFVISYGRNGNMQRSFAYISMLKNITSNKKGTSNIQIA